MGVLLLGLSMACGCLALQTLAGILSLRMFRLHTRGLWPSFGRLSATLAILTVGVFAQMAAWALLWQILGQFSTFEESLYFSGVTFTSLGYGDLTAKGPSRLLAPIEASVGLIMFAVVTAIFLHALQREVPSRKG